MLTNGRLIMILRCTKDPALIGSALFNWDLMDEIRGYPFAASVLHKRPCLFLDSTHHPRRVDVSLGEIYELAPSLSQNSVPSPI